MLNDITYIRCYQGEDKEHTGTFCLAAALYHISYYDDQHADKVQDHLHVINRMERTVRASHYRYTMTLFKPYRSIEQIVLIHEESKYTEGYVI